MGDGGPLGDGRSAGYLRTLGELYRRRLDEARADPPAWTAPVPVGSARLFEALPDTFTAADVVSAVDGVNVDLADVADWLARWVALGMAAEPDPGAFAKTGERPYRTDRGMLS